MCYGIKRLSMCMSLYLPMPIINHLEHSKMHLIKHYICILYKNVLILTDQNIKTSSFQNAFYLPNFYYLKYQIQQFKAKTISNNCLFSYMNY